MTKFKLIGAALALALPTAAFAAGSCVSVLGRPPCGSAGGEDACRL